MQRGVYKSSAERLVSQVGPCSSVSYLGRTQLNWLFFLAAAEKRRILLFFRDRGVERLLLRARMDLNLAPVVSGLFDTPEVRGLRFSLVMPPFVIQRTTDMMRLGEIPPAGKDDGLLVLAAGQDGMARFAAVLPKGKRQKMRFYYSPAVDATYEHVSPFNHNGGWPLRPFEDLFLVVQTWVDLGFENADEIPVNRLEFGPEGSHLRLITETVVKCFRELRGTISMADRDSLPGMPVHDLENFLAEIVLRTRADGNIARRDEDNPFHLLLSFSWQLYVDADHLKIAIGPPDFLVSGELLQSFLNLMQSDEFKKSARTALLKKKWPPPRISAFLRDLNSAIVTGNCTVFRVNRRREVDTDIIVIKRDSGICGWIFSGDFILSPADAAGSRRINLKGNLKILHEGDSDEDIVAGLFVKYFQWLCAEIYQWTKVMK